MAKLLAFRPGHSTRMLTVCGATAVIRQRRIHLTNAIYVRGGCRAAFVVAK